MDGLPCLCLCRCLTGCFVCAAVVHPEGHQVREGAPDTGMGSDSGALTQTRPGGFFNPPDSQLSPDSCRGKQFSIRARHCLPTAGDAASVSPVLQEQSRPRLCSALCPLGEGALPTCRALLSYSHAVQASQSHDDEAESPPVSLFIFNS